MTKFPTHHHSVMLSEVLIYLEPKAHQTYIDGTFGRGGYTQALLEKQARVIAIDQDPEAIKAGLALKALYPNHLQLIHGTFGDVTHHVQEKVQGFVLDLGVSSPQIDTPERGFSFRFEGPLDMRMDPSQGMTAADVVNTYDEKSLADILYHFGEERASRRIARTICAARILNPFVTTTDLAKTIRSVLSPSKDGLDPATRSFQALRIYVNQEFQQLEMALKASLDVLKPGGRLVVVSFHSLEDRYVKNFMRLYSQGPPNPSRHALMPFQEKQVPRLKVLTPRALTPSPEECRQNPRASSAKLRAAELIDLEKEEI